MIDRPCILYVNVFFLMSLICTSCFGCGILVRTGLWSLPMNVKSLQATHVAMHGDTIVRPMLNLYHLPCLVGASLVMMIPYISGNASSSALLLLLLQESSHTVMWALKSLLIMTFSQVQQWVQYLHPLTDRCYCIPWRVHIYQDVTFIDLTPSAWVSMVQRLVGVITSCTSRCAASLWIKFKDTWTSFSSYAGPLFRFGACIIITLLDIKSLSVTDLLPSWFLVLQFMILVDPWSIAATFPRYIPALSLPFFYDIEDAISE
jgi:hypothetical protein